jgi:periplasmic divalent cation tolerance protein
MGGAGAMSDDQSMVLVYIVCKDTREAKNIGRRLLDQRLVGCVNIFPIESAYWWEGQVVDDSEAALIAKTVVANFERVKREVLACHSYSVPCILKLPVAEVEDRYLCWLRSEIRQP